MRPKRSDWIVPVVTGTLGALVVFVLAGVQPDVVEVRAPVVAERPGPAGGDRVEVDITWSSPDHPGSVTETIIVPRTAISDGIIPVWVDGSGGWSLRDPSYRQGDYLLAAGIGLLLGFVMVMTIRGHGYVRGTGEPGSRPEVPVGEERGFYWRT